MTLPNLNRLLMLETLERVPDGGGGYSEVWVPLGHLWANVSARTGRERSEAGVPISAMSYKIIVRGSPHGAPSRPKPDQRFREGPRLFLIRAVAERDDNGRYLTCFADEEIVT
ncbi:head-tail adaptor protein [Sulfitobacter sp. BDSS02]|nr:head-tail adaptor protein [Sulfitobacter sp. BDSS02]MBR9850422.1 head-tail adaptor protein [Paracoccaceae bacterium]